MNPSHTNDIKLGGPFKCPKCGQTRTSMLGSCRCDIEAALRQRQDTEWSNLKPEFRALTRKGYLNMLWNNSSGIFTELMQDYERAYGLHNLKPKDIVIIKQDEWVVACEYHSNTLLKREITPDQFVIGRFQSIDSCRFKLQEHPRNYNLAMLFKDFDPNNWEESKKHLLQVEDGCVIKYSDVQDANTRNAE